MNQIIVNNMTNQNDVIQDEQLRTLMHDSFDHIFKYLGKENFLRWINMRNLSDRIKKLSIEEFSQEDKENYPTWNGYYTLGTDRIKLRNKHDINSNIHETYHFVSDNDGRFPTFMNEGLTEYLNNNTLNGSKAYRMNVSVAKFLHKTLGDSIIKAYLTGNVKKFEEYFSSYTSNDGNAKRSSLEDFYKKLNTIHDFKYGLANKDNKTSQSEFNLAMKDTAKYLETIASNYIRKKAQNLDYYAFGKLDFVAIKRDIQKMGTLAKACFSMEFHSDIENNITKGALTSIIENSPLVIGCDNKDKLISSIIEQIYRESQFQDKGNGVSVATPGYIDETKANELFNSSPNISIDLAKLKLENNVAISKDGKFDIIEFIRQVDNVQSATDMPKVELDTILGNYILQNCPSRS